MISRRTRSQQVFINMYPSTAEITDNNVYKNLSKFGFTVQQVSTYYHPAVFVYPRFYEHRFRPIELR